MKSTEIKFIPHNRKKSIIIYIEKYEENSLFSEICAKKIVP